VAVYPYLLRFLSVLDVTMRARNGLVYGTI
jgi:hypothetical protein